MKIRVMSDIHLDISNYTVENIDHADTLVLAGDIVQANEIKDYKEFFRHCSESFKYVIYVMGNHEHYRGVFEESASLIRTTLSKFPNIHLLDKEMIEIDGVVFIGATMWTNFNNGDYSTMAHVRKRMNDYRIIWKGDRLLTPNDTMNEFIDSVNFIKDSVIELSAATFPPKMIVVTHHSPSFRSTPSEYLDDKWMNGGYHSNLERFIDSLGIDVWIHGHTHIAADYLVGDCRIICNPRGYHSRMLDEQTGWTEHLILEV